MFYGLVYALNVALGFIEVPSFYDDLAKRNFSDDGMKTMNTLRCDVASGGLSPIGVLGFVCNVETLCELPVETNVHYSMVNGAFIVPDPFAERFARQCPNMLTKEMLDGMSEELDQGG